MLKLLNWLTIPIWNIGCILLEMLIPHSIFRQVCDKKS